MNIEDLISSNLDFSLFEKTDHDFSADLARKNNEQGNHHLVQLNFNKVQKTLFSL